MTREVLAKLGLDRVPQTFLGTFNSYDLFCEKVAETYREVAEMRISDAEEGAVLYFVADYSTEAE
jgi:hypothetical protein